MHTSNHVHVFILAMFSNTGEVEYPEFIEIMTTTLARLEEKREEEGGQGAPVPFALLATAYRCVSAGGRAHALLCRTYITQLGK